MSKNASRPAAGKKAGRIALVIAGLIAAVVVSMISPAPDAKVIALFERATK